MRASTPKAVSEPKTPGTGPAFRLPFDNSFFRDMQGFYVPWKPEPSPAPAWVQFNDALALELGLEPATLKSATGLAWLSGVEMPAEAAPLAQAQSDYVIQSGLVMDVVHTLQHARFTMRIVRQNLIWAAVYNAVAVPLALVGWMPPWLAGLGMAGSSFLVIANAMRLASNNRIGLSDTPLGTNQPA